MLRVLPPDACLSTIRMTFPFSIEFNGLFCIEIPAKTLPDTNRSSPGLVRSSSFESIPTSNEDNLR